MALAKTTLSKMSTAGWESGESSPDGRDDCILMDKLKINAF